MLWTAIGCLIGGIVLLAIYFIGSYRATKSEECKVRYQKVKGYIQIAYFLLFVAAAVLFLIW